MVLLMSATNTLLQALAPEALRGRVMSAYTMVLMGFAPMGALILGFVAHQMGAPAAVVIGGSLCTVSGVVFARALPGLREEARGMAGTARGEASVSKEVARS
jgi:MFS family permease